MASHTIDPDTLEIVLSRGTTFVQVYNVSKITLSEDDVVTFAIRPNKYSPKFIEKAYNGITDNKIIVELTKEETALISSGDYLYDISVVYADTGQRDKIVDVTKFTVTGVVHDV